MKLLRVVVLESASRRRPTIRRLLELDQIEVVGETADPRQALALVHSLAPQVLAIDSSLLSRGGLELIERVMGEFPLPVVIGLEPHQTPDTPAITRALRGGALSCELLPLSIDSEAARQFAFTVRRLARVPVVRHILSKSGNLRPGNHAPGETHGPVRKQAQHSAEDSDRLSAPSAVTQDKTGPLRSAPKHDASWKARTPSDTFRPPSTSLPSEDKSARGEWSDLHSNPLPSKASGQPIDVVGIGASLGGPTLVAEILSSLPADLTAPIVVVQHLPDGFAKHFADYLQARTSLPVRQVTALTEMLPGVVYLPIDDQHLIARARGSLICVNEPLMQGHRPSVDRLFDSLAQHHGAGAMGIVLSGLGSDGTIGLLAMQARHGVTIAQDGESAPVDGMPRSARETGAVLYSLPPAKIAAVIRRLCSPSGPIRSTGEKP